MDRMGRMCACVAAALALMAAVAWTAAATNQYKISGTKFTGTETISATLLSLIFGGVLEKKVSLTAKLSGGGQWMIVCTAMSARNGKIFENNRGSDESVAFSGCSVSLPAGCKLGDKAGNETTLITTTKITSVVEELGGLSWVVFTPVAQPFVTISLLGCAGEGTFEIGGRVRASVLTKTEEALKGINFSATTGDASVSLKFGTERLTLTGLVGRTLSGTNRGLVWSVS